MYCKKCGEHIEPGQKFCANCSAAVTESSDESPTTATNRVEKYKPLIIKISIFTLCAQILSLLLVITLLFLPIYTSTPTEPDAIQDWDDLREVMENDGKLNFSLWDDLTLIFDAIFPDEEGESDTLDMFVVLEMGLFPLLELFMIVLLLISLGITAYEQINNLCNADDFALLRYDEIKKSGTVQIKPSFWKKQSAFSVVAYAVFDIIFTRLWDVLLVDLMGSTFYRHMVDFSGVSKYVSVVIILAVGLIVVKNIAKKFEKDMRLSIAKE